MWVSVMRVCGCRVYRDLLLAQFLAALFSRVEKGRSARARSTVWLCYFKKS